MVGLIIRERDAIGSAQRAEGLESAAGSLKLVSERVQVLLPGGVEANGRDPRGEEIPEEQNWQ
jgi:hypothetical protein